MLQLESVTKHFATKTILKEASAHLRPGSRVGLVGPNGIGKTTLLRLILGEQTLDGGRIRKRPRPDRLSPPGPRAHPRYHSAGRHAPRATSGARGQTYPIRSWLLPGRLYPAARGALRRVPHAGRPGAHPAVRARRPPAGRADEPP